MTEREFDQVRKLLRQHSGMELKPGKEYLVQTRLQPIVADLGLTSVADLICALRQPSSNGLMRRVVEAMVITETSFFRDAHAFDALRQQVVPDLVERRQRERRLRIWSAACSTGQEPYSVAMILREQVAELARWDMTLLATDVSQEVLQQARHGRYNQLEIKRGLSAPQLRRHFRRHVGNWEIKPELRQMVRFDTLNLARPWPHLPRMDLILLRNVMIYFDTSTKREVLRRVAEQLRPDGYLLLGGAERTFNLSDSFRRIGELKTGIYQLTRP
jgi:chemotaxis protein methyltransferase CheR